VVFPLFSCDRFQTLSLRNVLVPSRNGEEAQVEREEFNSLRKFSFFPSSDVSLSLGRASGTHAKYHLVAWLFSLPLFLVSFEKFFIMTSHFLHFRFTIYGPSAKVPDFDTP